jgi:hypothetical protein
MSFSPNRPADPRPATTTAIQPDTHLHAEPAEAKIDRLAQADGWSRSAPAQSLIDTCRQYDVGLRVDPDGTLVVESYGRAWRSLVQAIGAHADGIANMLITMGDGQQMSVRRIDA